jgi:ribosomal peptide maturation radical SAM protein 1
LDADNYAASSRSLAGPVLVEVSVTCGGIGHESLAMKSSANNFPVAPRLNGNGASKIGASEPNEIGTSTIGTSTDDSIIVDAAAHADVVLVSAPFLSVVRPSLGISLLKAGLARRGITARIEYLNFAFAEIAGVELSERIAEHVPFDLLLGEWIFSAALYGPHDEARRARYLKVIGEYMFNKSLLGEGFKADFERGLELWPLAIRFADESARRLVEMRPKVLGFSTNFQQNCASLAIASRVRALDPDIVICFGGANCEGPMGRAMIKAFPHISYVFSGEADNVFPEFVQRVLSGQRPYTTDPSVFSPDDRKASVPAQPVTNLDELPLPDYADYFRTLADSTFRERVVPSLLFETSRGCWWGAKHHCRFCGLNGATMSYRAKSPPRIIDEIDELYARWQVHRFEAADNIMDMKHIASVFDVLADRKAGYQFFYEIKSNMQQDQLRRIARGGVTAIQPGIESLDDHVLQLMEKGVTGLQNIRLLRGCAEIGVRPYWNLLCGFPGERPEAYAQMAATMKLMEHLEPPHGPVRIRLDRFSPYYERAEELGFHDVEPVPVYRAVYNMPKEILSDFAYFFVGSKAGPELDGYVGSARRAVDQWRHRARTATPAVELLMITAGPLRIVKDTRSCAVEKWHILDDDELALLAAFRDPMAIDAVMERTGKPGSDTSTLRSAFERLAAWGYVVVDKDRALSLVIDPTLREHDRSLLEETPCGWLTSLQEVRPVSGLDAAASIPAA